jgi:hypothetical protein
MPPNLFEVFWWSASMLLRKVGASRLQVKGWVGKREFIYQLIIISGCPSVG